MTLVDILIHLVCGFLAVLGRAKTLPYETRRLQFTLSQSVYLQSLGRGDDPGQRTLMDGRLTKG